MVRYLVGSREDLKKPQGVIWRFESSRRVCGCKLCRQSWYKKVYYWIPLLHIWWISVLEINSSIYYSFVYHRGLSI